MPPQSHSLTFKQDAFCFAYIETGNASAAYRQVYNAGNMKEATIWRKANELVKNGKVVARLKELRQPAIEQAQLTLEVHLKSLLLLRDKAEADGKYGPAINAEISRGKAAGLYSSKIELSNQTPETIEKIPTAELIAMIRGAGK